MDMPEAGADLRDRIREGMIRAGTVRSNNTSGTPGVDWIRSKNRWRAVICFKGKRRYLGSFEKLEDAVRARKSAEEKLFGAFLDARDGKIPEDGVPDAEVACPPLGRRSGAGRLDLTGMRFGMLAVLGPAGKTASGMSVWKCRCDCGNEAVVSVGHLRNGTTSSCGCRPKVTLVDGTCVELIWSRTLRKNNTSGATGVERDGKSGKWRAVIFFKGERHYLGSYFDFDDAVKARRRGEEAYFDAFLEEYDAARPRGGA